MTDPAPEKPAKRKIASTPQLYNLNKVGRLADAIDPEDGKVYYDEAFATLADAQKRGQWAPKQDRSTWLQDKAAAAALKRKLLQPQPVEPGLAPVVPLDGVEYVTLPQD